MKFTRMLSLAVAAAAALSFTACDDDSSTAPEVAAAEITETPFTLGTQDQAALPSLLSIRKNGVIPAATLNAETNSGNVDVIVWEEFNLTSKTNNINEAVFFSPDSFANDPVWKTSKLLEKFTAAAKKTETRFAKVDTKLADIDTKGDLDKAVNAVGTSSWKKALKVFEGNVVAINASGVLALVEVTNVSQVDVAASGANDGKAVNVRVIVAQKL